MFTCNISISFVTNFASSCSSSLFRTQPFLGASSNRLELVFTALLIILSLVAVPAPPPDNSAETLLLGLDHKQQHATLLLFWQVLGALIPIIVLMQVAWLGIRQFLPVPAKQSPLFRRYREKLAELWKGGGSEESGEKAEQDQEGGAGGQECGKGSKTPHAGERVVSGSVVSETLLSVSDLKTLLSVEEDQLYEVNKDGRRKVF